MSNPTSVGSDLAREVGVEPNPTTATTAKKSAVFLSYSYSKAVDGTRAVGGRSITAFIKKKQAR